MVLCEQTSVVLIRCDHISVENICVVQLGMSLRIKSSKPDSESVLNEFEGREAGTNPLSKSIGSVRGSERCFVKSHQSAMMSAPAR
jgi:hypothetical protein